MRKILIITLVSIFLIILVIFLLLNIPSKNSLSRPVKRAYSSVVLANKENYLNCSEMPEIELVEKVYNDNRDLIIGIKNINNNISSPVIEKDKALPFGHDKWNCPGKANILITVDSDEAKKRIIETLGKDFKGVPYRVVNI
jgi:cellulose synthase/poly-beta-1,6-N-acetylglucosamine synthase-like glycosyltransferase